MAGPGDPAARTRTRGAVCWLVWTGWLALTLGALAFVACYASRFPIWDDLEMA